MSIQWYDVESSFIKQLGWDSDNDEAHARFHDGAHFRYQMAHSQFEEWRHAPSIGKYFHARIKKQVIGVRV